MNRNVDWNNLSIGDHVAETSQGFFNLVHEDHEDVPKQRQLFPQPKEEFKVKDELCPKLKALKLKTPEVTEARKIVSLVNSVDAGVPLDAPKHEKASAANPYSIKIVCSSAPAKPTSEQESNIVPRSIQGRRLQSPSPEPQHPRDGPAVTGVAGQRPSRLTKYAEIYAAKKKALLEKLKKEEDAKLKSMRRFRARSVPKYLKARKKELKILESPNVQALENKSPTPEPINEAQLHVKQHRRRSKSLTVITRNLNKQNAVDVGIEEE